ncbi:MAG: hypothetical protein ACOCUQ_03365 [Bacteroidota bacterium]
MIVKYGKGCHTTIVKKQNYTNRILLQNFKFAAHDYGWFLPEIYANCIYQTTISMRKLILSKKGVFFVNDILEDKP